MSSTFEKNGASLHTEPEKSNIQINYSVVLIRLPQFSIFRFMILRKDVHKLFQKRFRISRSYSRIISNRLKKKPRVFAWLMNLAKRKKEPIHKFQLFALSKIYKKSRITSALPHSNIVNQPLLSFKSQMIIHSRLLIWSLQKVQKKKS